MVRLLSILTLGRRKPPRAAKRPARGYVVEAFNCPMPLLITIVVPAK